MSSLLPLWGPRNKTIYSDLFNVPMGKIAVLFATGFERERVRVDNSEFASPQAACVRRIIHSSGLSYTRTGTCEWVASATDAAEVGDEAVQTCGACWMLTQDNNLRIIGVPGTYRLELNDATAVGVMQVYVDLVPVESVPPQIHHLFF